MQGTYVSESWNFIQTNLEYGNDNGYSQLVQRLATFCAGFCSVQDLKNGNEAKDLKAFTAAHCWANMRTFLTTYEGLRLRGRQIGAVHSPYSRIFCSTFTRLSDSWSQLPGQLLHLQSCSYPDIQNFLCIIRISSRFHSSSQDLSFLPSILDLRITDSWIQRQRHIRWILTGTSS